MDGVTWIAVGVVSLPFSSHGCFDKSFGLCIWDASIQLFELRSFFGNLICSCVPPYVAVSRKPLKNWSREQVTRLMSANFSCCHIDRAGRPWLQPPRTICFGQLPKFWKLIAWRNIVNSKLKWIHVWLVGFWTCTLFSVTILRLIFYHGQQWNAAINSQIHRQ